MTAAPSSIVIVCVFGVLMIICMAILAAAIRIVPEYRRLAVYRLGRYIGEKGPGLVFLLPFLDRAIPMDMQDQLSKAQAYQQGFGATGETLTQVDQEGSVEVDGRMWNAMSRYAIPPGTRVRVTKVILEVESL